MNLRKLLAAILILAASTHPIMGEETGDGPKNALESPSPDGRFAFRITGNAASEDQAYELIRKESGEVLAQVAKYDSDIGPSARFFMKVLWRPDSKAFALTATLWKRGSYVAVFFRDGASFREVKLPHMDAEIPDRARRGKSYPHTVELNSQSAMRWLRNGSLVVEIENIQDGNDGTITGNRTVVLGFDKARRVKIVKSTIKFTRTE